MALFPSPIGKGSIQASVTATIEGRTRHVNQGFFVVRSLMAAGITGYLAVEDPAATLQSHHFTLVGSYLALSLVLLLIPKPDAIWVSRLSAALDLGFILLLRHAYGLEVFVDANATIMRP